MSWSLLRVEAGSPYNNELPAVVQPAAYEDMHQCLCSLLRMSLILLMCMYEAQQIWLTCAFILSRLSRNTPKFRATGATGMLAPEMLKVPVKMLSF